MSSTESPSAIAVLLASIAGVPVVSPETYLSGLNEAQRDAVLHTEGPVLVVAGAGSGKTRVLTHRVAHLIGAIGAKANEILAITFTNRAADEMRTRSVGPARRGRARHVDPHLPRRLRPHPAPRGAAPRLQDELHDLRPGRPDPTGQERPRGARARHEALRPARDPRADLEREEPADHAGRLPRARRLVLRPDGRRRLRPLPAAAARVERGRLRRHADAHRPGARALPRGAARSGRRRSATSSSTSTRTRTTRSTGCLQLLAQKHLNLFAVGDPDQSIYAFRGADIRNIMEFEHDFPGTKTIALEQNYRSTNAILEAANAVISNNRERKPKNLWSEPRHRRPRARRRARGRARGGALRRGRDRAARRGGLQRRRDRGLLPDERAVARARGRARAPGHRVPGDRRPAVLRARRGEGPHRVPPGARQPLRHGQPAADREQAAPRHRRLLRWRGSRTTRAAAGSRSGRRWSSRRKPGSRRSRRRRWRASAR